MPARIAPRTAVLAGLAVVAASCGGAAAGSADSSTTRATTTTATTPSSDRTTVTSRPASGDVRPDDGDRAARTTVDDERPTTTRPPRTTTTTSIVVVPTEPPAPVTAPPTVPSAPVAPAPPPGTPAVPSWPPYTVQPGLTGVAALTGWPAPDAVTAAPILAVKIDNVGSARPQWALDRADVVFEENVEGATRFLALFHADVPAEVGPVRSARTTDIDLLSAMNRPVLGWSGGNPGVTAWIRAAAEAGLLVDVAAVRSNCYRRESSRSSPHNLIAPTACVLARGAGAGPARPLWEISGAWTPPAAAMPDSSFEVAMDNMRAGWTWDPANAVYLRSQNGARHVVVGGTQIAATNVVVIYAVHVPSSVDARSPEAITVGSGAGVVHRDGVAVPVTWTRPTAYAPFQFVAADGTAVPLQVGRTFVELARAG